MAKTLTYKKVSSRRLRHALRQRHVKIAERNGMIDGMGRHMLRRVVEGPTLPFVAAPMLHCHHGIRAERKEHPVEPLPITTDTPLQSPLPAWVYPILNPTLKFVLRSPLHILLSSSALILIFVGRKSGTRYHVVVVYHDVGGNLYTFSNTSWSKNFIGGAPVALRLHGTFVRATARVVDDMALIGRVIQRMAHERGEQLVTSMGLIGSGPDGITRLQMPQSSRLVEFTLER